MKIPVLPLSIAFVFAGCSEETPDVTNLPKPPTAKQEIKKEHLLAPPDEDVLLDKAPKSAVDFPDLVVKTVKPGEGDAVLEYGKSGMFHLYGSLSSGKKFKNTRALGAPEEIRVVDGGGLRGLVFGCLGMKKGEVRSLVIPPELAYGEAGDPAQGVPANATVIVRAELVEMGLDLDPDLLIRRMKKGKGDPIRVGQTGQFHYTGIIAEGDKAGVEFDSSRREGRITLPVTVGPQAGVLDGWKQGLIGMRVGEQRWLKIPPHLAYGAAGQGDIPPNATLIFELELVSIDGADSLR